MPKTVNLRDLPDDLVKRAKAHAALSGISLKDFVVKAIAKAVEVAPDNPNLFIAKKGKRGTR